MLSFLWRTCFGNIRTKLKADRENDDVVTLCNAAGEVDSTVLPVLCFD